MGIMDNIKKASEAGEEFIKALLFGPNGSGKSTLCGTAPPPILYLFTERQGLVSFKRMAPDEDTLQIKSLADLREVLKELKAGQTKYRTVVLDSFTEMQLLVIDEIAARKDSNPNDPVKLSIEERLFVHDRSKNLVRSFRDLPMNVVITCLAEQVVVGEGEKAKTITRVMLSGQKLPAQIGQFFNLVGYVYKGQDRDGSPVHRVLFDGRSDLDTKGMPGLRLREEPDIEYWYERAIKNGSARDGASKMLGAVSRTWATNTPDKPVESEPEEKTEEKVEKKSKKK